jgi:hypothetical protein
MLKSDPKLIKGDLSSRGWVGMWLGRSSTDIKGYEIWCPQTRSIQRGSTCLIDEEYYPWLGKEAHQPLRTPTDSQSLALADGGDPPVTVLLQKEIAPPPAVIPADDTVHPGPSFNVRATAITSASEAPRVILTSESSATQSASRPDSTPVAFRGFDNPLAQPSYPTPTVNLGPNVPIAPAPYAVQGRHDRSVRVSTAAQRDTNEIVGDMEAHIANIVGSVVS